jgi:hypothetical protein
MSGCIKHSKPKRPSQPARAHEALGQIPPASRYEPSARAYEAVVGDLVYEPTWQVRRVRGNGLIKWNNRTRFIGAAYRKQMVGLLKIKDGVHQVYFADRLLGELYDDDHKGLRPVTLISRKRAFSTSQHNPKAAKKGK